MDQATPASDAYVTRSAWLQPAGRSDLVDEVADQFERPVLPSAADTVRWPRHSRGWRCEERLRPSVLEHRVAG